MNILEDFRLSEVSGGVFQLPDVDGNFPTTPLAALEVGATGMGDNYSYTGTAGGYSAAQCATLGTLSGIAAGLVVGGTCSAVAGLATGGLAVPACGVLGSISAAATGTASSGYCNTRSGRP